MEAKLTSSSDILFANDLNNILSDIIIIIINCSLIKNNNFPTTNCKGGSRVGERGAEVEAPQAPRGVGFGEGVSPSPTGEGSGEGAVPPPQNFF